MLMFHSVGYFINQQVQMPRVELWDKPRFYVFGGGGGT